MSPAPSDGDGEPGTVRIRAVVTGRVQGVWFRGSTAERARELCLSGWVRNLANGAVEAMFEGPPDAVEAGLAFLEHGPPAASVDGVNVIREEPEGVNGFEVRYD